MSQRIRAVFDHLRAQGRKALIPFIMGGDPDGSTTAPLLLALEDAGADLIEVGIPFSDPLADGPTIQRAAARALDRGATPAKVLSAIASVRHRIRVPIVCLSYWNPIVQFGDAHGAALTPEPFLRAARASGVSGVIVPDLPVEEGALLQRAAARCHLATIYLAAPTSPPERLRNIVRASDGFIYYVSVTGTTGARRALPSTLVQGIRHVKLLTTKPVCVGFGISTPTQARAVAQIADGVIIGSALIDAMAHAKGRAARRRRACAFLAAFRRVV